MQEQKTTHKVYQLETTMDAELEFQKSINHTNGSPLQPEVFFKMTDVSFESEVEIVTSISIKEAKQMIKGLKTLIKEVEEEEKFNPVF